MPQQRKFFPGWLVVASGFVIMATCYTIFVNCMSLFQPLIVSDLGISLAQYNISNAISTVVSVIGSLVIGHVADKVSGRVLGSLTVIATSAVLASMSFVGELWQVYVLFAVSGCFAVASTRLLISLVTANWFTAKRGLAISIALSGSGFGGAILSPIVSSLIVGVGWRSAFLVLAAICMVAALPSASKQFGMADLGKVTGTITSLEMVGGTVGAIVSGVLFDATGSFASTWIVCLACSVVMLVFLLVSEPIAAKLRASVAGE